MNLDEAIKKRYSCRVFKNEEITDQEINVILDAARYAPSPKNRQPWRFIILRKDNKHDFLKLISSYFLTDTSPKSLRNKLNELNSEKDSYKIMKQADTIILVFNKYPSQIALGKKDELFDSTNIQAIGAAIQNMILKATDLGIGSLWICDIFAAYQQICDKYYPDGELMAAVALGYTGMQNTKKIRKPLSELKITQNDKSTKHLIWIGPRESDIYDCRELFCASVTIFGTNQNNNTAFCSNNNVRIDHNSEEQIKDWFWNSNLYQLKKKYPDAKFLYYNSEYSDKLSEDLKSDVICLNPMSTLKMLKDKITMRIAFSQLVPVVPFQQITYSEKLNISNLFPDASTLIFQENISSGGFGTHVVNRTNAMNFKEFEGKTFMVSPYYEKSVSVNTHLIIGSDCILSFPGSIQIVHELNNKIVYLGADYITFQNLSSDKKKLLYSYVKTLGRHLQKIGYRGVVGFDFLITRDNIMFVEVNARFQASTHLLNTALKKQGLPTIQEMHIMAFEEKTLPDQALLDSLVVPYSMISYIEGSWNKPFSLLKKISHLPEIEAFFTDGFSENNKLNEHAYLFKILFKTNCTSITPDFKINIYENLLDIKDDFYSAIIAKNKLEVKISLLNQGVIITEKAQQYIKKQGEIRKAVFSAVDLTVFGSLHINCPRSLKFSEFTPWQIDINKSEELELLYEGTKISTVSLDLEDTFAQNYINPDVKFSDVCFWATDRLRIHHTLSCCLKKAGKGCKFCEVPSDDMRHISIDDILAVVDFYLKHANTFRHFLIGGGSEPRHNEYKNVIKIVDYIRQKSSKDIYVMTLPPEDKKILKEYFEAGVTEIGFNIEIFDPGLAQAYMPGKGVIQRDEYFDILKEAVNYWGNTGNVRSLIIVGFEPEDSLIQGIEKLCKISVMPILSVFRPIPGTETENIVPPSNHFLRKLFIEGTKICEKYSLHLGPACPACQNNTLSLPFK